MTEDMLNNIGEGAKKSPNEQRRWISVISVKLNVTMAFVNFFWSSLNINETRKSEK